MNINMHKKKKTNIIHFYDTFQLLRFVYPKQATCKIII